jgi:hypothetical protein
MTTLKILTLAASTAFLSAGNLSDVRCSTKSNIAQQRVSIQNASLTPIPTAAKENKIQVALLLDTSNPDSGTSSIH